jgi:phage terminase small subunit
VKKIAQIVAQTVFCQSYKVYNFFVEKVAKNMMFKNAQVNYHPM